MLFEIELLLVCNGDRTESRGAVALTYCSRETDTDMLRPNGASGTGILCPTDAETDLANSGACNEELDDFCKVFLEQTASRITVEDNLSL